MVFTVVSFHAHPDDEALLCGGTLARAAAEGHRVVIVFATDGEAGLSGDYTAANGTHELGTTRRHEARTAGSLLGAVRVEFLGYPDSGSAPEVPSRPGSFATIPHEMAAARLAAILLEEQADALTIYDPHGGYGHPDHRQVHQVGALAAAIARTPLVLEVTIDRSKLWRLARLAARIPGVSALFDTSSLGGGYAEPGELTHRVDVRAYASVKRAALEAHRSQRTGGSALRTVALLLRLPRPVFRFVLGREWFIEQGRTPQTPLCDDIFDSLRAGARPTTVAPALP